MYSLYSSLPVAAVSTALAVYSPQTGDTNLNWLIPAAVISAALIVVLIVTGRRRR